MEGAQGKAAAPVRNAAVSSGADAARTQLQRLAPNHGSGAVVAVSTWRDPLERACATASCSPHSPSVVSRRYLRSARETGMVGPLPRCEGRGG